MMGEFVIAAQIGAHEAQGWTHSAYGTTKVLFTSFFFFLDNLMASSNYNL